LTNKILLIKDKKMNTKIRISIWIVALSLVFSGITLSSQQVFAASGLPSTAGIIDDRGPAIAEFLASLPSTAGIIDDRGSAIAEFLASLPSKVGTIDERGQAIAEFLASLPSSGVDLTTLNAVDAMAYRYTSMAKYYAEKSISQSNSSIFSKLDGATLPGQVQVYIGYGGVDLTTLSPVDAMAYRFTSLAYYYATHPNAIR
jgi:hypothetical protein